MTAGKTMSVELARASVDSSCWLTTVGTSFAVKVLPDSSVATSCPLRLVSAETRIAARVTASPAGKEILFRTSFLFQLSVQILACFTAMLAAGSVLFVLESALFALVASASLFLSATKSSHSS